MLISIIVPAFNAEKSIKKCLESICSQKYKDIEVICVDDCSTDKTLEILQEIKKNDKRIKLIAHNKNLGQSAARNDGISMANGDYITFVDSDDYIDKDTMQLIAERLRSNNYPDVIRYNFVSTNRSYDNNLYNLATDTVYTSERKKEILNAIFVPEKRIPTYSVLLVIKNKIAKHEKFDQSMTYLEDAVFYHDIISSADSFLFCDLRLYNYIDNDKSATRTTEKTLERIENMLRLCERIESWPELTKFEKRIATARVLNLMASYLIKLGISDYKTYKKSIIKLHNDAAYRKWVDYSNLKKLNALKRKFLKTIKRSGSATITRPYLLVGKFRYGK